MADFRNPISIMMQNKGKIYVKKFIILLFWLGVWQILAMCVDNFLLVVTPLQALRALLTLAGQVEFWRSAFDSLWRIAFGFLLGAVLALLLAAISYRYPLAELKSTIDNEVWQEWCEALAACQYDHSLKSTLNPIVGKLSDMRIINGELENLVFAPRKEFISMAALVVLNIPLLYFLNKDWYATLMTTVPGKAVLAVCAAAIFLSFARVVKLTQPIEYRR